MPRINEPVFTSILRGVSELRPVPGSLYITGVSVEERSSHTSSWEAGCRDVTFARLVDEDSFKMTLSIEGRERVVLLRSEASVSDFLEEERGGTVYLDITGLPHRVWAPLLRCIRSRHEKAFCVYVEPGDYRFSPAPTEVAIFDLSERIEGIEPLPGFVSLSVDNDNVPLFIPLLGFEGPRFAFMLEAIQPKREDIFPIIGVPWVPAGIPVSYLCGKPDAASGDEIMGKRTLCRGELPVFSLPCPGRTVADQSVSAYGDCSHRYQTPCSGSGLVLPGSFLEDGTAL